MIEDKILFSVYTREPDPNKYPAGLAQSVHFAYLDAGDGSEDRFQGTSGNDEGTWKPLNKNYGILFAEGEISPEDTIVPMGVIHPWICDLGNGWIGIGAEKVYENGEPVMAAGVEETGSEGTHIAQAFWKTRDLIHFVEADPAELVNLPDQAASHTTLAVDRVLGEKAIRYWTPIVCTGVEPPENENAVSTAAAPDSSDFATFHYSDGSTARKRIHRPAYHFPLAKGFGDPVIFRWEGKWYFLGTTDNRNCIGIYVREAESVAGLFTKEAPEGVAEDALEGAEEHLILPYDEARGLIQTFWAPEFHVIGGELYILFAVSGHAWGPQCHLMRLKKGGRIICAEDWEDPVPVVRMDGSPLAADGISLDMTYIGAKSGSYMVWSYRRHIGTPMDTGSMLYIASVDEKEPWRLTCDPVLLTRPLLGWENVLGTINNEGPHAFARDGKIYLTYSGGSANAYTYALGLLTADSADDLTRLDSWTKSITPVLTYYSVEGEYGPGHNSFYTDEDGELMIAYHAETALTEHLRCDGIRRVHFRKDGTPYFQMSAEEDQPKSSIN